MNEDTEERLAGQIAIVTGGASGIGRATCLALARQGANVVVTDINRTAVQDTLAMLEETAAGGEFSGHVVDVREEQEITEMVRQTLARFGRIDILVAGAGILRQKDTAPKPLFDLSTDEWEVVLDTNLKGTFLSNRAVLPAMMAQRKGQIVNISSTSGRQGRAYDSAYCASKFGIVGLSEALAEEVRQYQIKVHLILPDAVDTPLWEQNGPIPRPPDSLPPIRVADLIIFLLTLPGDTILLNTTIAGFRSRRMGAKRTA